MAKLRGRGMASMNYPIGMNLGGDPSQALVHSNPSGKFTVSLSSIDLGQGMKSVTRQICAETLGVPVEDVYVDTADSDTGPHCMGSFASRGTHRVGNAVMAAAREARGVMMEAAAEELEVNVADLETDGRGNIHVKGAPHRSISTKDVAIAAQFRQGAHDIGTRHLPRSPVRRRSGDRRDVAGDLLRPRLSRRRSRGRRRNRRSRDGEDGQRLRAWSGAQSAPGRAAARRRRLDGHQPRPLRDARAVLSGSEPRAARFRRVPDARAGRHLPA